MRRFVPVTLLAFALLATLRIIAAEAPAPAAAAASGPGEIKFTTHNTVYNCEGSFQSWKLTKVDIPGGDLTKGTVAFEIDLASVNEKTAKLAAHLRTADFFDVATFPKATVVIHDAKPAGDKKYNATADVDLHGMKGTTPVAFEVVSSSPLTIKGTATLSRSSFKVGQPYDASDKYSPQNEVAVEINAKLQ
ncbi:MAG TPA: YceI family protein [Candidatus Polarisedimenticolaceae bacterium]|nr:YceI family protein [Candidatus Polarisedimenticolaceae bacterium]